MKGPSEREKLAGAKALRQENLAVCKELQGGQCGLSGRREERVAGDEPVKWASVT